MTDDVTLAPGAPTAQGAPVRVRALRRDDFDRVLELERELFGPGAWTYGMLAEELAGWGRWYIVAEEVTYDVVGRAGAGRGALLRNLAGRRVVGYAGLWFDGDVTQVMTIGVDTAWQRRGVGRVLMEALIGRSVELGASAVLLEVRVDNEPALALYADLGFERLGIRKRYYQPENKDAYTMRLDLGGYRASGRAAAGSANVTAGGDGIAGTAGAAGADRAAAGPVAATAGADAAAGVASPADGTAPDVTEPAGPVDALAVSEGHAP